jgi:branched-chain amino acid transport system permease protein
MLANFAGVLFDGIAYGSLLFLISVGLSVTMGMMNFINLAHGAFAMLGGYVSVTLLSRFGVPFLASLPLAFIASALVGLLLERVLYRRLYKASHLDQVLFSIGLTFMAVAGATYFYGPTQQPVVLPDRLRGQVSLLGLDVGAYRLFLIGVVVLVTVALGLLIERTRFGAQIRASVDNQTAAAGLGINVSLVFSLTFALGSGLAGLGGGWHRRAGPRSDLPGQVHGLLPARGGSGRRRHHQGRCWPLRFSACSTSPVNTTCPKLAPS